MRFSRAVRFTATACALPIVLLGLATKSEGRSTASASFGVTTTVQASCQALPTRSTFKNYAEAWTNATSSVSVSCTNSTPYNVSLSSDTATTTGTLVFKLNESKSTESSLSLPSDLLKSFSFKRQSNGVAAIGTLASQAVNRPYALLPASASPGTITIVITY